jgi:hypothetical protein
MIDTGLTLDDLAQQCYDIACSKGFHDDPRSFGDDIALILTECGEAYEAYRDDDVPLRMEGRKPVGQAVEIIDAIIRSLETLKHRFPDLNVDEVMRLKMAYNRTRPHKHGRMR